MLVTLGDQVDFHIGVESDIDLPSRGIDRWAWHVALVGNLPPLDVG